MSRAQEDKQLSETSSSSRQLLSGPGGWGGVRVTTGRNGGNAPGEGEEDPCSQGEPEAGPRVPSAGGKPGTCGVRPGPGLGGLTWKLVPPLLHELHVLQQAVHLGLDVAQLAPEAVQLLGLDWGAGAEGTAAGTSKPMLPSKGLPAPH